MKVTARILVLLAVFGATLALAQTPNTPFKHVIIVVQENRTPDNLFGSDAFSSSPQLPGADLATQGSCKGAGVTRTAFELNACFDIDHSHQPSWVTECDADAISGKCKMDNACAIQPYCKYCPAGTSTGVCPSTPNLPYTYVDNSDSVVQPYFDIAKQYGYANYMFQTNQGPSFPAHLFLFSGTSAPTAPSDPTICYYSMSEHFPCYQWFAAENYGNNNEIYGCVTAPTGSVVSEIDPNKQEAPGFNGGRPCYDHDTMAELLDANHISWKYYARDAAHLWTAPTAFQDICNPASAGSGFVCTGGDWINNVQAVLPANPPVVDGMAPPISDIEECHLPAVSWVTPDGAYSDHPGKNADFKGAAWVAAIVNTVGNNKNCDGNGYWKDTVILITWDDWGGWYDHVTPPIGYAGSSNPSSQYV
jgi:phospholipase C